MNWMRGASVLGVIVGLLLSSGVARADEELPALPAPAPEVQTASAPKDVVRLKNGGIVRGTIIELETDKHVTIQLPTGQTRTFRWTEATYAGPERDAPSDDGPTERFSSAGSGAPPRVEKRVRSTGALFGGIASVVASQISLGIAMVAWFDQLRCENDRRQDEFSFRLQSGSPYATYPTHSCSNTGTIAAGIVGGIVLLGVGVPLIVYGAKRVPVEKPTALRFVPWNQGTTAAGGSLQLRF